LIFSRYRHVSPMLDKPLFFMMLLMPPRIDAALRHADAYTPLFRCRLIFAAAMLIYLLLCCRCCRLDEPSLLLSGLLFCC